MVGAHHLSARDRASIRDPIIRQFADLAELQQAAKNTDDRDPKYLNAIGGEYEQRIPALFRELERRHVAAPSANAFATTHSNGLVFTTAHESNGLEFDQVLLADDFCDLTDDKEKLLPADKVPEDELILLYVAATRAERALHLNDGTRSFLRAIQRAAKVPSSKESPSIDPNRSAATSASGM
jgi:F-box protein, helicase, 18